MVQNQEMARENGENGAGNIFSRTQKQQSMEKTRKSRAKNGGITVPPHGNLVTTSPSSKSKDLHKFQPERSREGLQQLSWGLIITFDR